MLDSILPIAQIYGVNTVLYERALEGLDAEALRRRPSANTNPPLWIAGHLASVRFGIAAMLGHQRENPLGRTFIRGSVVQDVEALPDLQAVRRAWSEGSALLRQGLEEATEVVLAQPSPRKFPIEDASVRGAVTFLSWHEGYHLGQMSLLRRWNGLSGPAG
jgi:hypothetical protein